MRRFASLAIVVVAAAPLVGFAGTASATDATSTPYATQFAAGLGAGANVAFAEDEVPLRSVENLRLLAGEFLSQYGDAPLPARITGILDRNADGLDDDGKVNVRVFGNEACLRLTGVSYTVASESCAPQQASVDASAATAASRVDAARRWHVHAANAAADTTKGVRISGLDVASVKAAIGEARAGVRITNLRDRNHDGLDDDGKLGLTTSKGAVCLKMSRDARKAGSVVKGAC